ncbi:hypothetical protein BsWGS_25313 [Bradybaena similaris]
MNSSRSGAVVPFLRKNLALWNVTNLKITDSPHCMASFTIPGLSHESFDIDANPKITSLMITSVLARAYALNKPDSTTGKAFLDWPTVSNGRYTFVSSTELRMSQDLYNPEIPKWPLDAKFSLGNVGNTSIANVIEFYVHGKAQHLWTNVTQLVCIDSTTRKPTPLPDWFKEQYKGKGCLEKGFIVKPFERPPITFVQPVTVSWSDTDIQKHTNFASYVRFALDCLHAAVREEPGDSTKNSTPTKSKEATHNGSEINSETVTTSESVLNHDGSDGNPQSKSSSKHATTNGNTTPDKPLQGITKEKIANGLKTIQICYLSESLEGETLNVHIWQEAGLEYDVWCAVERDSKDICQIKLEYFDTPRTGSSD